MVFRLCRNGENRTTYIFTNRSYMFRLRHRSHHQTVQNYKQVRQCVHNVILRRVCATSVVAERQKLLHIFRKYFYS